MVVPGPGNARGEGGRGGGVRLAGHRVELAVTGGAGINEIRVERKALEAAFPVVLQQRDVGGETEVLGHGRAVSTDQVQESTLVVDEDPSVRRGAQHVDARGLPAALGQGGECFQVHDEVALGDGLGARGGSRQDGQHGTNGEEEQGEA